MVPTCLSKYSEGMIISIQLEIHLGHNYYNIYNIQSISDFHCSKGISLLDFLLELVWLYPLSPRTVNVPYLLFISFCQYIQPPSKCLELLTGNVRDVNFLSGGF